MYLLTFFTSLFVFIAWLNEVTSMLRKIIKIRRWSSSGMKDRGDLYTPVKWCPAALCCIMMWCKVFDWLRLRAHVFMNHNKLCFCCHSVTNLDLWGVLVATGAVCIIYCTLVSSQSYFCSFILNLIKDLPMEARCWSCSLFVSDLSTSASLSVT